MELLVQRGEQSAQGGAGGSGQVVEREFQSVAAVGRGAARAVVEGHVEPAARLVQEASVALESRAGAQAQAVDRVLGVGAESLDRRVAGGTVGRRGGLRAADARGVGANSAR
ncbi:hypothetical protein A6A25_23205 [Saccharothrix sp. CB00851]|nr:hypothetical protein A6A25_23205 [Saccharothrix sp. CB00851]